MNVYPMATRSAGETTALLAYSNWLVSIGLNLNYEDGRDFVQGYRAAFIDQRLGDGK